MLALIITLAVLILIALLRFGVIVVYDEDGFHLWVKAGFLKFEILDDKKKTARKKIKKRVKKRFKDVKSIIDFRPGSLSVFMDMLKAGKNTLRRLRRRLLIKQLTLYYTSAGENPANTALQFGAANAVLGAIVPTLKENFRIKKMDLRTWFDFNSQEQKIYAKINISLAVWEAFYIISATFPAIIAMFKNTPPNKSKSDRESIKANRKDGQEDGKETDKRLDGNNNAKDEGTD